MHLLINPVPEAAVPFFAAIGSHLQALHSMRSGKGILEKNPQTMLATSIERKEIGSPTYLRGTSTTEGSSKSIRNQKMKTPDPHQTQQTSTSAIQEQQCVTGRAAVVVVMPLVPLLRSQMVWRS